MKIELRLFHYFSYRFVFQTPKPWGRGGREGRGLLVLMHARDTSQPQSLIVREEFDSFWQDYLTYCEGKAKDGGGCFAAACMQEDYHRTPNDVRPLSDDDAVLCVLVGRCSRHLNPIGHERARLFK